MSDNTMLVRIIGEPFLTRAVAYRGEYNSCCGAWHTFRESVGAIACRPNGTFQFSGEPVVRRTEWRRPKYYQGRDWWCARQKTALQKEIQELPSFPSTRPIFGDAVIEDYHYKDSEGGSGSGAIGHLFFGPNVGWAGDVFVCTIPDPIAAVHEIRKSHPDAIFEGSIESWTPPPGLVRITAAESELIFAQAKVENERRAAAREMDAAQ